MKLRKPVPLIVLLTSPCFISAERVLFPKEQRLKPLDSTEILSNDQILALNHPPRAAQDGDQATTTRKELVADSTSSIRNTASTRPYRGTEDAPVDGLDGKPHAGPFVDTSPDKTQKAQGEVGASSTAKSVPTSLERLKEDANGVEIPEKNDGVMNDETRTAPKKGTTGTEGGISEKEKEKAKQGVNEGKPQPPKEAPPLPHSEQERIAAEREANNAKDQKGKKQGGEYGIGGYGMEKPTNLPEKPHNIPHPEPGQAKMPGKSEDGPPVGSSDRSSWLVDTMPDTEGKTNPRKPKAQGPSSSGDMIAHDDSFEEWFHSFVVSFTMIIFTEIGDKTFLVAALMAMRHPRLIVFSGAFAALAVMTVLSAVLGHIAPTLLPKRFTTFAAAILFLIFGAKMLREGLAMSPTAGVGEEMKEVEAELEEKEHSMARRASRNRSRSELSPFALEAGRGRKASIRLPQGEPSPPSSPSRSPSPASRKDRLTGLTNLLSLVLSPAWVQTFVMTFLGEWGDRSQIATIAMAAGQDYWLVTLGAVLGHACCTGLAVLGGRALAGRVSMRVGKSFIAFTKSS